MPTFRMSGSPAVGRLVGWVFILIGLLLLALGWHLVQQQRARVAHSVRTTGVVESLVTSHYTDPMNANYRNSSSSTAPTIRYRDATGRDYVFTATAAATRPASYSVGQQVAVYYDPDRPYDAQLHGFLAQWMGPTMAMGAGVVFAGLGLMAALVLGRRAADS